VGDCKVKNVVICGATGINNSGDEAILTVAYEHFKSFSNISVITLNKSKAIKYHPDINFINISNTSKIKEIIKNCDLFLLGGGGLFQDETTIFNVFRWYKILRIAQNSSAKIMLYANSVGPLKYKISRRLVKKALNKVDLITLRDESSYDLLKKIGIKTPCKVTADPVFSFDNTKVSSELPIKLPKEYVAFSVRHWFDTIPFVPVSVCRRINYKNKYYKRYIEELKEIVLYINNELNLPVVFLPFIPDRDNSVVYNVIADERIKEKNIIIAEDCFLSPSDMISIIKQSKFLFGMRLHSIIYSTISEVPFIALAYSSKVNGILSIINQDKYAIDIRDLSLHIFTEKLNALLNDYEEIENELHRMSAIMKERESENTAEVKKLLDLQ